MEGKLPSEKCAELLDKRLEKDAMDQKNRDLRFVYLGRGVFRAATPDDAMSAPAGAETEHHGFIQEYPPETDPTGRRPSDPGAKLDAGKPRAGLVLRGFSRALDRVVDVGTHGATKYSPGGWQEVPEAEERYLDALYRHLQADARGEKIDRDSGLKHFAQVCWNCLAILELRERRNA